MFLSCVSAEFRSYRELLTRQLCAAGLDVECQEHFPDYPGSILELLDEKVGRSDFVVHLVGRGTGFKPKAGEVAAFLKARPERRDLIGKCGLAPHAADSNAVSYTQWEYWLGRYHGTKRLVYKADADARRDPAFRPADGEAGEQDAHLDRLRDTFDARSPVTGDWHLASRVLVSLIAAGTLAVPEADESPAIVLGVETHGDGYASSAAVRWRGRTVRLAEREVVPAAKGSGRQPGLCDRLTELIRRGNWAFDGRELDGRRIVVELVLSDDLLARPLGGWVYTHETLRRPVPVRDWHPVRVRLAGRDAGHTAVHNIRARLDLLRRHQERVAEVCRRVPDDCRTPAAARPLAVVHEAAGEGCWHPTAVVCGGFHAPPPKPPSRSVRSSHRKPTESQHLLAVLHGVPFLVWPDAAATADEVEAALRAVPRPVDLCEFFQNKPFAVFAESRDPPFPVDPPLVSPFAAPGAGP